MINILVYSKYAARGLLGRPPLIIHSGTIEQNFVPGWSVKSGDSECYYVELNEHTSLTVGQTQKFKLFIDDHN